MIAYIANTTVYVSDQERALDFYVNKLGFEQRSGDNHRWLEVAQPGVNASIVLKHEGADGRIGQFAGIVFGTDDIHETYEYLRLRGVTFTEAPTAQPQGMLQAEFVDHDGNGFILVQP